LKPAVVPRLTAETWYHLYPAGGGVLPAGGPVPPLPVGVGLGAGAGVLLGLAGGVPRGLAGLGVGVPLAAG